METPAGSACSSTENVLRHLLRFVMPERNLIGCRVLVVEDNYMLATDLVDVLRQAGAHVVGPVATVRDALDALDPLPDVATLDVQLGKENSFPIAAELARRGVPFVFATGTVEEISPAYKARPVYQKPVPDVVLLKALSDALSASA